MPSPTTTRTARTEHAGITPFTGFEAASLAVLDALRQAPTRDTVRDHRSAYDDLIDTARSLVVELGLALADLLGRPVRAEPRIDGSIQRLHRDARFLGDAAPYRHHLLLRWWEGDVPPHRQSTVRLVLGPDRVEVGAGVARFDPGHRAAFRRVVSTNEVAAVELTEVLGTVRSMRGTDLAADRLHRVPAGLATGTEADELLRLTGLAVRVAEAPPACLADRRFVEWALRRLRRVVPVHEWWQRHIGPS